MINKEAENVFAEFYNSAKDLIADRFSSPFIFSFVVSWVITNYKIVMTVLTNQTDNFSLDYKFWLINEYLSIYKCLWIPLLLAIFYTFVYPYIDNEISKFTLNRKNDLKSAKITIEKARTKTEEDVENIIEFYLKNERKYKSEISDLRNEAALNQESINVLQAKLLEYENKNKKENTLRDLENAGAFIESTLDESKLDESNLDEVESFIITGMGHLNDDNVDKVLEETLFSSQKYRRTEIKIAIDSLVRKGLIKRDYVSSTKGYSLTLLVPGLKAFQKMTKEN